MCAGGAAGGGNAVKVDWVTCWWLTVDICGRGGDGRYTEYAPNI